MPVLLGTFFAALMIFAVTTSTAWEAGPGGREELCASPAVIFRDSFEPRALGSGDLDRTIYKHYKHSGWAISDNGSRVVSNSDMFDGTKSLEFRYPSGAWANGQDGAGAGFMDHTELYFQHYVKWSENCVWSPAAWTLSASWE